MWLTVQGPAGDIEETACDSCGHSLGALFNAFKVEQVAVNGNALDRWQSFVPARGDRVKVICGARDFGISAALASAIGISTATATTIVTTVTSIIISTALSAIVRALTPRPAKAKLDSNRTEAFGIAGFSNTTGRGTPAFVPYGLNKIWGHVISSGAKLSPTDASQMIGKILLMVGDTGGDGVQSISDIRVDGTSIDQFEGAQVHIRLGGLGQTVIPEFENVDKLWGVGQQLAFDTNTMSGTPFVYTTVGSDIQRATLIFNFPNGLYRVTDTGNRRSAGINFKIERKRTSEGAGAYFELPQAMYFDTTISGTFRTYQIDFPDADKWDIRVTVASYNGFVPDETFIATAILFNVEETVFTTKTYPGWALLGITNIQSKQVRSLQNMNISAMIEGKLVKVPDGSGNFTLQYTRKRCWIVRDMMTHPIVGMGSEIAEGEIDGLIDAWIDAQNYYDEMAAGHDGNEVRDLCDYVVSDSDWDWEHVKKVCGEARGRVIPSGNYWKYVIDKPDTPNILYTEGANVIDGSVSFEIAPPDRPFTEITAQFRDADQDYEDNFSPAIKDPDAVSVVPEQLKFDSITRESQVQREAMIAFKRNFLERRRWSFASPQGAIVSEPMDLDYFDERGIGGEGAFGGILPAGSSTSLINLPDVFTLQPAVTYALIVKHLKTNVTEYRTILTGAGSWGQVEVTAPFTASPLEGDAFSLGIQDVEHIITRAQELEIDNEGRVKQIRTEYVPAVYTQDPLPPKSSRRFFNIVDSKIPIPLRDANVQESVVMNQDGSTRSALVFDVTPGLSAHSGQAQGGANNLITVASAEPDRDDYFNGAKLSVIGGTGSGQSGIVTDYLAEFRAAIMPFITPPQADSIYLIEWERFGEFGGFRIESSEDAVNYIDFATVSGTHYETDSRGLGPGQVFFRFTPRSTSGVENAVARILKTVILTGDISAPAAPVSVAISSYLLNVRVLVALQRPVAEDFSGVEIELWRNAIGTGTLLEVSRFGAPGDRAASGLMQIEATFNVGARTPPEVYGNVIWARARSIDYSNNASAFVNSPSGTTLAPDPNAADIDVTPPAIPQGLTLTTGVQIDPVDGTSKPYIEASWIANTEPSISHYEVHFRIQGQAGVTVRIVYHPQISIREIGVLGGTPYEVRVQAINSRNQVSNFTAWTPITTVGDTTAPGTPSFINVIGGFKQITVSVTPPGDIDYEATEVWYSTTNNRSTATYAGDVREITFTITGLADDTTYFIWLTARDHSGNHSAFVPGQTAGVAATTRKIGPNDIVAENLITNYAQIGVGVIQDANIGNLTADKIIGGTLQTHMWVGVGNNILIYGPAKYMAIWDENGMLRVQTGKLGAGITDYGLQIFKSNGTLMWSFTEGVQTNGRQEQNQFAWSFTHQTGASAAWFAGVFIVQNDTLSFTVRVSVASYNVSGAKGATRSMNVNQFRDFTVNHGAGKTMAISPSLTNINDTTSSGGFPLPDISATLQVHYW